jgi:division protein CdvB (Snf7/Vps24/ESCRT-III family)
MSTKTESLRDLYMDITGEEATTEPQQESPSHDPIEEQDADLERSLSTVTREDGLEDAVDRPSTAG